MNKYTIASLLSWTMLIILLSTSAFSDISDSYYIDIPSKMVLVEGGNTMIGAEAGDLNAADNAKPIHLVVLSPYYIDQYEVTNKDYSECVAAGECEEPKFKSSETRDDYYSNSTYANFPVVNVSWEDANHYCEFVGKRLPTEAEWELAATGNTDYRRYSWGNTSPKAYYVNTSAIPGDTQGVGAYVKGNSPYGLADTQANVAEWVSDWYDEKYYSTSESENPQGPRNGVEKVVRGNSWQTLLSNLHITTRVGMKTDAVSNTVGFRCAMDLKERIFYNSPTEEVESSVESKKFATVNAGNSAGLFLMVEPGGKNLDLVGVIPNGSLLEIIGEPIEENYVKWYNVMTTDGRIGWTIGTGISVVE